MRAARGSRINLRASAVDDERLLLYLGRALSLSCERWQRVSALRAAVCACVRERVEANCGGKPPESGLVIYFPHEQNIKEKNFFFTGNFDTL